MKLRILVETIRRIEAEENSEMCESPLGIKLFY